MSRKRIILVIVLMAAGLAAISAQETAVNEAPVMAFFPQYGTGQMLTISPMAYPSGFFGQLGMSFLNIFFGLGSWISGDWINGLVIGAFEAGGIALTLWGVELFGEYSVGPAGDIFGFWLNPGFWAVTLGVSCVAAAIIQGFVSPFKAPIMAQLKDPRNWTVALFPTPTGNVAGALAFTAHF